jgi:hypothetical protein
MSRRIVASEIPVTLPQSYHWHDVRAWGVEGRGWADTERFFDRLPARASGVVRDVIWNLSRHATGMSVWGAQSRLGAVAGQAASG